MFSRPVRAKSRERRSSLSLGQNTAVNLGAKAASLVLALFVSAYVVHRLGLRVFGFWAVISAVSQYAALLDFGVGFSLTRFVARADELGDQRDLRHKAASGLWSSVAFAAAITAVTALATAALPSSVTSNWPDGWQPATIFVAASLGVTSIGSVLQAFPNGMGRWDLSNLAILGGQIAYSAVACIALYEHGGLLELGLAGLIGSMTMCAIADLSRRRIWGNGLSIRNAERADLRMLWSYGMSVQTVNLVQVVNAQADKLVLLPFSSLSFVGLYELGARVAYTIRALPLTAFGPLIAAAARESAEDDASRVRAFYERSYRTVLALGVAPLAALYGASYALIIAWVGGSYKTAGVIAVILGFGYTINVATGAGTTIAMGAGRPDIDRNYSLLGFALNAVLTVALGLAFGRWGVITATTIGLVVSSVWLLRLMDHWLGSSILSPRKIGGSRATVVLLMFGFSVGAACTAVGVLTDVSNRFAALALGVGSLVLFAFGWLPTLHRTGILTIRAIRRSARRTPPLTEAVLVSSDAERG